jgi:hypothetical protein
VAASPLSVAGCHLSPVSAPHTRPTISAVLAGRRGRDALLPVLEAAREVTREVTGNSGRAGGKLSWTPHITIAYSTAHQPTGPIISAPGQTLPERKVQSSTVNLVNQQGPERKWDWQPRATVRFEVS